MCIRDISYSPPSGSPISPPSANSTDSAGSSLSIDESEQWNEGETLIGRYSNSLTPDEAIAEIDENPDSPMMHQGYSPHSYVPMNPISSDDGYVDMSPGGGGGGRHNMSPAASTSSVTSGTPSTDLRFAEYHLEKVTSYLTPSEDETSSTDRPIRAYSVGSRSEYAYYRTRPELSSTPENSRVRAFSVGSKKNHHNRVLPPHSIHPHHGGAKSSSAPILSNSRLHWMNDHMELDFSKKNNLSNSGYVEMKPGNNRANEGYVEMKPGRIPEVSPYVDMRGGGSSPAKNSILSLHHDNLPFIDGVPNNLARVPPQDVARNDYVDMSGRNNKKTSPPTNRNQNTQSGYMDMNFHNRRNENHLLSTVSPVKTTVSQGSPSSSSMDYMDMDMHNSRGVHENEQQQQSRDGYVEMTLGSKTNHQRQSSQDANPDYANMNCGTANRKKERMASKKEKMRSQPIAIQTTTSSQGNLNLTSGSPVYTPVCRKYSTGTPPKMFLPLSGGGNISPFSSLPRQKSNNATRKDSKDSSSSSLTTPSSSSTIFPISINSPSSPIKPQKTETTPVTMKIPQAVVNIKYNKSPPPPPSSNEDYIMMDFEKKRNPDTSEYVNFNPAVKPATLAPIAKDEFDDYAVMKPGGGGGGGTTKIEAKPKTLGFRPITESRDDLSTSPKPGDVAPPDDEAQSSQQQQYVRSESVNSEKIARTRPGSTTSELGSSTSTIVGGGGGSRPSSVNSERIRPASVSGTEVQLHYASLDLARAAEEEGGGGGGSKSPRALKQNEQGEMTGFTYAEIDFIKSEQNARVKH